MEWILEILQTILVVSVVIGIVWLFGELLGKRAGYGWRKLLWLVLALRLLCPVSIMGNLLTDSFRGLEIEVAVLEEINLPMEKEMSISEKVSAENVVQTGTVTSEAIQMTDVESANTTTMDSNTLADGEYGSAKAVSGNKIPLASCIFLLWGVTAVGVLGLRMLQYHNMKKKCFAESIYCEDVIILETRKRLCDELQIRKQIPIRMMKPGSVMGNSPMLFGYVRTVLLLPQNNYNTVELEAVMRHELNHYRAKDLWYKLLLMVVCDLYWFNPVLRLMKKMAFWDVEFVCDEKATVGLDLGAKKVYSNTILKTMSGARGANVLFATRFAGNKKSAKERFENIFASYNRKVGIAILVLLVLVIGAGTIGISVTVLQEDEEGTVLTKAESIDLKDERKVITIDAAILSEDTGSVIAKLGEKYPNIEINVSDLTFNHQDEEFVEQESIIFQVDNVYIKELVKDGRVADITDVLEKRGWLKQMNEAMKATVSDENGRIYGIPLPYSYAYGLMVNIQMFEEAGLTDEQGVPLIPATWEELAQTAVKIKEATGEAGICLLAKDYAGSMQFCNIAWNFGATELVTLEPDGSYKAHLDSVEAIRAMEFVKALKWKYDVLTTDPLQEDFSTGFEHLANGTAAMYLAANDAVSIPIGYGMDIEKIALGAVPAGAEGEQHSIYGGSVLVFSKDATTEEIEVGLSLVEMLGKGPMANDAAKERIRGCMEGAAAQNTPIIPEIPVWNKDELLDYEQRMIAEIGNVNQALYQSYFDAILSPGNLKGEDAVYPSVLYEELLTVLRAVIADEDADVAQLMKKANDNWQKALDTYSE